LPKCESCGERFNWGKIYRSIYSWKGYKPFYCDNCGVKHMINMVGRMTAGIFTVIPMMVFMLILTPFEDVFIKLGAGLLIFLLGTLITPYLVNYEEET